MARLILAQLDAAQASAMQTDLEAKGNEVTTASTVTAVTDAITKASKDNRLPDLIIVGEEISSSFREDPVGVPPVGVPPVGVLPVGEIGDREADDATAGHSRDDEEPIAASLRDIRATLDGLGARTPILYLGDEVNATDARRAGADQRLPSTIRPSDIATLGQLFATYRHPPDENGKGIHGQLSDYGGVFYLVRALAAIEFTGVLFLIRGLRRGELRFFQGEVTSAQVGTLHGMAALHQLLLWNRAHFELLDEDVIRRQQIPLSPQEILEDAERFLAELRTFDADLSTSSVYDVEDETLAHHIDTMPDPVQRVLHLFDGYRSLADVVEDSPYRVLETLRLSKRLIDRGLIISIETQQEATFDEIDDQLDLPTQDSLDQDTTSNSDGVATASRSSDAGIASIDDDDPTGSPGTPDPIDPIDSFKLDPLPDERPLTNPSLRAIRASSPTQPRTESAHGEGDAVPKNVDADTSSEEALSDGHHAPIDWSDVLPTGLASGFSPVVPATAAAGEIDANGLGNATKDGHEDTVAIAAEFIAEASSADIPIGPTAGSPSPYRGRRNQPVRLSLWQRLFGRQQPSQPVVESAVPVAINDEVPSSGENTGNGDADGREGSAPNSALEP